MLPKKIYLNYVDEDDEEKTWCVDPVYAEDCDMQNREYTDLSQVWHDAKEEPEKGKLLIGIDEDDVSIYKWVDQDNDWLSLAEWFSLIRWAYLEDLLPREGNNDVKSTNNDDTERDPEIKHMDFSHILQYLKDGATARRESWSGNKSIFLSKDTDDMLPFICINTKDGHKGVYTVTACDLLAEDWMVIKI